MPDRYKGQPINSSEVTPEIISGDLTISDFHIQVRKPKDLKRLGPVLRQQQRNYRESTRKWLAIGITILLSVEVLFFLAAAAYGWLPLDQIKELVAAILVPTVTLGGTVLGFYFSGMEP